MSARHHDRPNLVRRAVEIKVELARNLTDPQYVKDAIVSYTRASIHVGASNPQTVAEAVAHRFRLSLRVGETYTITPEMGRVLVQAADELPDDYIIEHHHLHAEHGFVVLGEPIHDEVQQVPVHALSWHNGTGWSPHRVPGGEEGSSLPGLEINLWGYWPVEGRLHTMLVPVGSDFQPYGFATGGWDEASLAHLPKDTRQFSIASRFVMALQMFMRQELPALARHPVPRSDVRTLRRLMLPVNPIAVVDLRRRAPSQEVGEGTGRHLTDRHIVRGHWRTFHVGPDHPQHPGTTESDVKIHLYVQPYVRGPEGTPLRPTPTHRVHVVRR